MLALLLVAISAGLSNMTGALAIGVSGVDAKLRLRVGLVFGLFESLMPVVGLLIGRSVAGTLGRDSGPAGGALLGLTGLYTLIAAFRQSDDEEDATRLGQQGVTRLLIVGLVLSIDNLVIGFALGTYHVELLVAAVTIGVVSVSLSLVGLEFGARIGRRVGEFGEHFAGVMLIGVGCAIGFGLF